MGQIKRLLTLLTVAAVCFGMSHPQIASATTTFTLTPSSSTITEGYSKVIGIQPAEPIICTVIGTCNITFSYTSSDPQVSIDSLPTFATSEWASTKNIIISTHNNHVDGPDKTVTLHIKATSLSEFYNNASFDYTVNLQDNNEASQVTIDTPVAGQSFFGSSVSTSGTGPIGSIIYVMVDGVEKGHTTADSEGKWQLDLTGLGTGNHTLSAATTKASDYAYLNNQYTGKIDRVDMQTHQILDSSPQLNGVDLVYNSSNNKIYAAANQDDGSYLAVLNANTLEFTEGTSTTSAGTSDSITLSPDKTKVYLLYHTGTYPDFSYHVDVFDTSTASILSTFNITTTTNDTLSSIQISPDGSKLWVRGRNFIKVINTSSHTVAHTINSVGGDNEDTHNIVFKKDGTKAYTAGTDGHVYAINTSSYAMTTINVDEGAYNVGLTPDESKLYVLVGYPNPGLTVIDTSNNTVIDSQTTEFPPESITFTADGHFIAGDDHASGQIYFGKTSGNATVDDTVIFEDGGSYRNFNTNFLSTLSQRGDYATGSFEIAKPVGIPNTGFDPQHRQ